MWKMLKNPDKKILYVLSSGQDAFATFSNKEVKHSSQHEPNRIQVIFRKECYRRHTRSSEKGFFVFCGKTDWSNKKDGEYEVLEDIPIEVMKLFAKFLNSRGHK